MSNMKVSHTSGLWVDVKHCVDDVDFEHDTNETSTKADDFLTTNARQREAWARADNAEGIERPQLDEGYSSAPAINYVGKHRRRSRAEYVNAVKAARKAGAYGERIAV
jgi:hypothetical protein